MGRRKADDPNAFALVSPDATQYVLVDGAAAARVAELERLLYDGEITLDEWKESMRIVTEAKRVQDLIEQGL